ncbi:MAG TPA: LysR family transcriptional regulator [Anaeromyxobacteraceae bacterium]|nr:LysR family transcriptional regulator [Anaeromyxobacteraceae bacterium]
MDLNRITAFVRVVEAGSFTAAAAALGLRKSSVSRSVAALEADLGIRLLQRTTRKLSLTDAGRAYYDRTRDALSGIEEARQAVSSLGAEPRGLVRVTAPVDLARDLAAVTAAFLRANAGVRVETVLTARYVDLVKEGFDLAVRAGPLSDSSLHARRLGDAELGLFASPAYLDRIGRPRRLAELARHECILYRAGSSVTKWRLSGPRGDEEVSVHGRADTDELSFARAMALAGFGIALVPVTFVAPLVETGEIERVLSRYAQRSSAVHIVWPSRRFEPAAVRLFREALAQALPRALGGAATSIAASSSGSRPSCAPAASTRGPTEVDK